MTTRRVLVSLVSAVALGLVAASTWFDLTHLSMSECMDEEARAYPRLERIADEVMEPVGDRVARGSFCEDAVQPGAYVMVSVYDWTRRREAGDYLRGMGAHANDESALTIQGFEISYMTAVDHQERHGQRHVKVYFGEPG